MTPIFKITENKFDNIGEYRQNFHDLNNRYFRKEIVYVTPFLSGIFKKD